jgi:hypothetical protein
MRKMLLYLLLSIFYLNNLIAQTKQEPECLENVHNKMKEAGYLKKTTNGAKNITIIGLIMMI